MTPCVMIEVIPTVAMQNNKNSTISLCLDYRAQDVVLFEWAVALPAVEFVELNADPALLVEVAGPLLQVGQCAFAELLENGDVLDWLPPAHVGQKDEAELVDALEGVAVFCGPQVAQEKESVRPL